MGTKIKYQTPSTRVASNWQVKLSDDISSDLGFDKKDIKRSLKGTNFIITLPSSVNTATIESVKNKIESGILLKY